MAWPHLIWKMSLALPQHSDLSGPIPSSSELSQKQDSMEKGSLVLSGRTQVLEHLVLARSHPLLRLLSLNFEPSYSLSFTILLFIILIILIQMSCFIFNSVQDIGQPCFKCTL